MSSPQQPRSRLTRRTFVGAVTTIGAAVATGAVTATNAAASTSASASAAAKVDTAVGVARFGSSVYTLGRGSQGWVLVAANGSSRPTTGLDGADVLDLAGGPGGAIAVGAVADGDRSIPTVWESRDGLDWQAMTSLSGLDGHLTALAVREHDALAMGSLLTLERAPRQRIAVRYKDNRWEVSPVNGLEHTDEWTATAAAGDPGGWIVSTVDSAGSVLATSPDGVTWTASSGLVDTSIRSLAVTGAGVRWVGNAMGGSGALTGVVGAGRRPVPVAGEARALGVIGDQSYWLAGGRIVSATV